LSHIGFRADADHTVPVEDLWACGDSIVMTPNSPSSVVRSYNAAFLHADAAALEQDEAERLQHFQENLVLESWHRENYRPEAEWTMSEEEYDERCEIWSQKNEADGASRWTDRGHLAKELTADFELAQTKGTHALPAFDTEISHAGGSLVIPTKLGCLLIALGEKDGELVISSTNLKTHEPLFQNKPLAEKASNVSCQALTWFAAPKSLPLPQLITAGHNGQLDIRPISDAVSANEPDRKGISESTMQPPRDITAICVVDCATALGLPPKYSGSTLVLTGDTQGVVYAHRSNSESGCLEAKEAWKCPALEERGRNCAVTHLLASPEDRVVLSAYDGNGSLTPSNIVTLQGCELFPDSGTSQVTWSDGTTQTTIQPDNTGVKKSSSSFAPEFTYDEVCHPNKNRCGTFTDSASVCDPLGANHQGGWDISTDTSTLLQLGFMAIVKITVGGVSTGILVTATEWHGFVGLEAKTGVRLWHMPHRTCFSATLTTARPSTAYVNPTNICQTEEGLLLVGDHNPFSPLCQLDVASGTIRRIPAVDRRGNSLSANSGAAAANEAAGSRAAATERFQIQKKNLSALKGKVHFQQDLGDVGVVSPEELNLILPSDFCETAVEGAWAAGASDTTVKKRGQHLIKLKNLREQAEQQLFRARLKSLDEAKLTKASLVGALSLPNVTSAHASLLQDTSPSASRLEKQFAAAAGVVFDQTSGTHLVLHGYSDGSLSATFVRRVPMSATEIERVDREYAAGSGGPLAAACVAGMAKYDVGLLMPKSTRGVQTSQARETELLNAVSPEAQQCRDEELLAAAEGAALRDPLLSWPVWETKRLIGVHQSAVTAVVDIPHPSGALVASGGQDGFVRLTRLDGGVPLRQIAMASKISALIATKLPSSSPGAAAASAVDSGGLIGTLKEHSLYLICVPDKGEPRQISARFLPLGLAIEKDAVPHGRKEQKAGLLSRLVPRRVRAAQQYLARYSALQGLTTQLVLKSVTFMQLSAFAFKGHTPPEVLEGVHDVMESFFSPLTRFQEWEQGVIQGFLGGSTNTSAANTTSTTNATSTAGAAQAELAAFLGSLTWTTEQTFFAALATVPIFVVCLLVQEAVEEKQFLFPKHPIWPRLWKFLRVFCNLMAGALFLPVFSVLADCFHCVGGFVVFGSDSAAAEYVLGKATTDANAIACWGGRHWQYMSLSLAATLLYVPICIRFLLAGSELANLEIEPAKLFRDWSHDKRETEVKQLVKERAYPETSHPFADSSARFDTGELLIKMALTLTALIDVAIREGAADGASAGGFNASNASTTVVANATATASDANEDGRSLAAGIITLVQACMLLPLAAIHLPHYDRNARRIRRALNGATAWFILCGLVSSILGSDSVLASWLPVGVLVALFEPVLASAARRVMHSCACLAGTGRRVFCRCHRRWAPNAGVSQTPSARESDTGVELL
jgi:hypothetical protein